MTASRSFQLLMRFQIPGFSFNPENKLGMTVSSNDGRRTFSVVPKCPDEDGFGHRLGVEACMTSFVDCDADQYLFICKFIDGELLAREGGSRLPLFSHGDLAVTEGGKLIKGVPFWFDWFSPDIRSLVDDAIDHVWEDFTRLWRILRWEQKSAFRIPDRTLLGFPYWRTATEGLFHAIPRRSSITIAHPDRETGWFGWEEAEKLNFSKLWTNPSIDEPIGHELQNEAELLVERAPRSALLMATAAVEAGVKEHIGRFAPTADWLIREMPSPPVGKLLKKYLPVLHQGNPKMRIWNQATALFNKFENVVVPERNKLSHAGKSVKAEDVRDYITLSRDILYLIDYLGGHDWALENLSGEAVKIVGLPTPPEHRREVQIALHAGPHVGAHQRPQI